MARMKGLTSRIAALATALGIAVAFTAGTAGTASAAAAGFKLCNYGSDYYVSAVFSDRGGFSTYLVGPNGACTEVTVSTDERFHLHFVSGTAVRDTMLDRTYGSGRTLVQTWGSFRGGSPYGKLPY